ncbi:MAG: sulfatase [Bryobacterales bacterium]|nr:sulfatase [Bryobacterales bacterium]
MLSRRQLLLSSLAAPQTAPHTNLVVVFADDLGYGDLGCYGSTTIRTPRLDRMAREGLRFTHFYAGAPFCSPSRAALLTGRYPIRAGVPNVLFPTEKTGLPPSEITIARLLKQQGYATACIGKWHLGDEHAFRAHRHGFDSFYGLPYSNDMFQVREGETFRAQHARQELPLRENDQTIEAPVNQHTLTQRYTDRAIAFIEQNRNRPFFLYLPHTFPHSPQYASPDFEGRSPHGFYADAVEELDASTGRILDALTRLKLARNTLVVFTSDNGPAPGRKGEPRWTGGSAGSLRGAKGNTYEGGMRVPAIFWQPGRIAAGKTVDTVASVMDLLPTAAQLARAPLPEGRVIDGQSLRDLLYSGTPMPERLFCYYFGGQLQAVRRGKWKLVLPIHELPERPPSLWYQTMPELFARHYRLKKVPELYDVTTDIAERNNAAGEYGDVVRELTQAAARFDNELQGSKQPMVFVD